MSSLVVDSKRSVQGGVGYLMFRLFYQTFEMNLAHFNELFHLPNHSVLSPIHDNYNQGNFQYTFACSGSHYEA